jgi:hypothetical protein
MKRTVQDTNSLRYKLTHNQVMCFLLAHDYAYPTEHASNSHMECKGCKKRVQYDQNTETVLS